MSRFLFFYTMRDAPDRIRDVVPRHVDFWRSRNLPAYLGGPFADRSGGLITFAALDLARARATVLQDPFVTEDLVQESWVKEWSVE